MRSIARVALEFVWSKDLAARLRPAAVALLALAALAAPAAVAQEEDATAATAETAEAEEEQEERKLVTPAPPRGEDEGEGPFERLIIRGVTMIDGTGSPPYGPVDIVIEGNRIAEIESAGTPGLPFKDDEVARFPEQQV